MGFTSGSKVLADIVDEVVDGLIASSSYWEDGDTTWDTSDRSRGNDNARRCLKYTGDSDDIWIAFEVINSTPPISYVHDHWADGLRVSFSASWDDVNHTYPADTYANSQTFIACEDEYDSGTDADMANVQFSYYLWIDSTGFALMARPETTDNSHQQSFICVIEHMNSKEYSDGLTNFYCFNTMNIYAMSDINNYRNRRMLRPFAYQNHESWNGIMFWEDERNGHRAIKSTGNGKVYYVKPVICNSIDNMKPIYQSELFWAFSESAGLVDGDVVAVDGETTKYLCKSLDSPDSTNRLNYAIKYVA